VSIDRLDAIYAEIPDTGCRGLCQIGCSSVALAPAEQHRIFARHGVDMPPATAPPGAPQLTAGQQTADHCPALTGHGRCGIYPDRPLVCRLWGSAEGLQCPYGCRPTEGVLDRARARRLLLRIAALPSDAPR
jgi:hypothetical protein